MGAGGRCNQTLTLTLALALALALALTLTLTLTLAPPPCTPAASPCHPPLPVANLQDHDRFRRHG